MKYQKEEVDKMQKKLKELIGESNSRNNISKVSNSDYNENSRIKNISNLNNESKSVRNENIKNSRLVSIKTNKYYENGKIKK
jgi:hypothetical protein